jgi:hypothetical protein
MTAENRDRGIPDWAEQERERDLTWLQENMLILSTAARSAFQGGGRGAIVVDTTVRPVEGMGHPFGYYLQETIETTDDADAKRMVSQYDPEREFVVTLLKPEGRVSTYRLQIIERVKRGRPKR